MKYFWQHTLLCARRALFVLLLALLPLACEKPYAGEGGDDGDETETVDDAEEKPSGGKTHPTNSISGSDSEEESGNGEETDIEDGDGDTDYRKKTYTVMEFLHAQLGQRPVMVEGYIVGACSRSVAHAEWTAPFTYSQALLLADRQGERDVEKVMSVKLKSGNMRSTFNLVEHPENQGRRVYVYGTKQVYLGIPGMSEYVGGYGWAQ